MPTLNIDWKHLAFLFGSAAAGAALGYLDQQQATTLAAAFSSWGAAAPLLHGAAVAALVAIVGMARKSFLVPGGQS
jgi:hypothetical protein